MKIPPLREFINTSDEWHATVVGFCEAFVPWRPTHRPEVKYLPGEFHYYVFGRVLGFLSLLTLIIVVIEVCR